MSDGRYIGLDRKERTMIEPTVGRIVWYHPGDRAPGDLPWAAIVVCVHNAREVNLTVFDDLGFAKPKQHVQLRQDGDVVTGECYCEWMPYQKSVAKGEIAPTLHATERGPS